MSQQPKIKTWTKLAEVLSVGQNTLRAWRTQDGCPKSKDVDAWKAWIAENKSTGKGSGRVEVDGETYTADDIRKFKATLTKEQGRKETAIANLRELEYEMKASSLVPESELKETLSKLLVPLRRLLDTAPRQCAATANPENPQIAELAIRTYLDDRVFAEVERIMKTETKEK